MYVLTVCVSRTCTAGPYTLLFTARESSFHSTRRRATPRGSIRVEHTSMAHVTQAVRSKITPTKNTVRSWQHVRGSRGGGQHSVRGTCVRKCARHTSWQLNTLHIVSYALTWRNASRKLYNSTTLLTPLHLGTLTRIYTETTIINVTHPVQNCTVALVLGVFCSHILQEC